MVGPFECEDRIDSLADEIREVCDVGPRFEPDDVEAS